MATSSSTLHPHLTAFGWRVNVLLFPSGQLGYEWLNLSEVLAIFRDFILVLKIALCVWW